MLSIREVAVISQCIARMNVFRTPCRFVVNSQRFSSRSNTVQDVFVVVRHLVIIRGDDVTGTSPPAVYCAVNREQGGTADTVACSVEICH